jgi:alpha-beta hydrolase superfamily lysophospholipase
MSDEAAAPKPARRRRGRRALVITLVAIGAVALVGTAGYFSWKGIAGAVAANETREFQDSLADFYAAPAEPAAPGALIRIEELGDLDVPGGTGYRMLYGTQAPDGTATVSSGMLFVPDGAAPAEGRPVLAWAHGTLGFGDDCTPSRTFRPTLDSLDFGSWLPAALQRGWVVAATDYAGVGTAGDPYYLIAQSEAQDVINSVRAARAFAPAAAGTRYATFGHSQGGHASLATAEYTAYAPELELVAVSGAAPAAELGPLFSQQYTKPVAWGDGPSVAVSWPLVHPGLPLQGVLSDAALEDYSELAHGCLLQEVGQLLVKKSTDQQFFRTDPLTDPQWADAVAAETIDPSRIAVPVLIVQSLSDNVVLPNTNALLSQRACAAGSPRVTVSWLDHVTHEDSAVIGGMLAIDWLQDRFTGIPASDTCGQPLPIAPAEAAS